MIFHRITAWLLCLAGMAFPFSVAVTNIAAGGALALGLIGGELKQGIGMLFGKHRRFAMVLFAYILLVGAGLFWSMDRSWGVHVLSKHWCWLLVPLALCCFNDSVWRRRFMIALSIGLVLHLVYCVFQLFGYVSGTTAPGSGVDDATGHIGHIGFGFVYGIWAAWLLHWGWLQSGLIRYGAWLCAAWAWLMIFLAQGRSGYLVAVATLALVLWRLIRVFPFTQRAWILLASGAIVAVGLSLGGGGERLLQAWKVVSQNVLTVDREASEWDPATAQRFAMWRAAYLIWQDNPWLGVGTGGYPSASKHVQVMEPSLDFGGDVASHPHNIYLLALVRWGVLGLFLLVWLLFEWIRIGLVMDWGKHPMASLASLTGLALAVHGMTSTSIEEHFSIVFAVLLLALALAENGRRGEPVS